MSVLLFRVRRYRVLLLFSAFAIALWYHFSPTDGTYNASDEWLQPTHDRGTTKEKLKSEWSPPDPDDAMPPSKKNPHHSGTYDTPDVTPTPLSLLRPGQFPSITGDLVAPVESDTEGEDDRIPIRPPSLHDHVGTHPIVDNSPAAFLPDNQKYDPEDMPHWTKLPEHFPIPPESIIPLPTGEPKLLPKIQYNFKTSSESNTERNERLERQGAVKDAFKHAWEGYRKHAWGHDEVTPVSGGHKDPFAGWAATLVDALDTMAIMGLHAEFEQALTAVAKIDFTITTREDIPMFETTIRYLGGLIGAYDVTGQKHKILLNKAVELAEILYNAFDTPNRMPVLYFEWHPDKVKQKHRAGKNSCMAELGSLSVEFTRLAQITGEDKYFDAIQRITNEFDKFLMNTTLPGFWPITLDASGCQMVEEVYTVTVTTYPTPTADASEEDFHPTRKQAGSIVDEAIREKIAKANGLGTKKEEKFIKTIHKPAPKAATEEDQVQLVEGNENPVEAREAEDAAAAGDLKKFEKRGTLDLTEEEELEQAEANSPKAKSLAAKDKMLELSNGLAEIESQANPKVKQEPVVELDIDQSSSRKKTNEPLKPVVKEEIRTNSRCIPTGFQMNEGENKYSYGGMSDSTYEYLLKEHILLGGLMKQYGDLYVKTYETGRSNLFFRPMTPKNKDILVSGDLRVGYDYDRQRALPPILDGAGSHLTCFVGGMVGMGAKILERPEDLEVAMKLTDGCVWNYFSTASGIMPENFVMAQCPKTGQCQWDEHQWLATLMPPAADVIAAAEKHNVKLENPFAMKNSPVMIKRDVAYDGGSKEAPREAAPPPLPRKADGGSDKDSIRPNLGAVGGGAADPHGMSNGHIMIEPETPPTRVGDAEQPMAVPAVEKDAYEKWYENVHQSLKWSKLPPGYTSIGDTRYILRPEAIESVFYMYRITGDKSWQEKGWKMFEAVQKFTKTEIAHTAIQNVLDGDNPGKLDSMESFWLAETLKYFYLLFSEPDVISLDDYVFNTEAHPLSRPKPKTKF
ncbi:hypothetical protein H072_1420 [Dactylellina haptotyla CBS 200.50]|uniref:alpha-1,2-Mannosidase n=1 Tax=Dactylellina haptotyla (strain CBS 200.50) TaxID=1284197 RepID=S8CA86_DACHA|nr:hypothetical protein H072_1420 [Dactylellina haptotyla CBS 200.50]